MTNITFFVGALWDKAGSY